MRDYVRQNPHTGYWMNAQPCEPCLKELGKRGRHRAHECIGGGESAAAVWTCDCECRALTTRFKPPVMRLS